MNDDRVTALILAHLARYPLAGSLDVYKLLHQAAFGPGHLIASKKAAREWLESEISLLEPSASESLIENIHPDGAIVRLHLRPYIAHQGKVKPLIDAMVRSAEQVQGDPARMADCWRLFERLCAPDGLAAGRFAVREVMLFGQAQTRAQWPAAHHSPEFNRAYRPRYRVLTASEAEALCDKLKMPFEPV